MSSWAMKLPEDVQSEKEQYLTFNVLDFFVRKNFKLL